MINTDELVSQFSSYIHFHKSYLKFSQFKNFLKETKNIIWSKYYQRNYFSLAMCYLDLDTTTNFDLNQWFSTQIAPRPVYLKKKIPRPTMENLFC